MQVFCYFGYNIFHLEMILGWSGGTVIVQEGGQGAWGGWQRLHALKIQMH